MLAQGKSVTPQHCFDHRLVAHRRARRYSVTKAEAVALTEALGIEWAERGVRVVAITLGVVATPMAQAVFDQGIAARATYEQGTHRLELKFRLTTKVS